MTTFRYSLVFFLLCLGSVSTSVAMAQQDANNQPPMTPAVDSRESLVSQLDLEKFEAAKGDLSACQGDADCLKDVDLIKSWVCASDVCNGIDKTRQPAECFDEIAGRFSKEAQGPISTALCSLIQSPSSLTRQVLLSRVSGTPATEIRIVAFQAYLMAIKQSAQACEAYIKDYVGAYGPNWKFRWYRSMAGCRILAGERTLQQEQNDFYIWFGVEQGLSKCSDIANTEMQNACSAPQAASPTPYYEQYP